MKQKTSSKIILLIYIATLLTGCGNEPPKPQTVVINLGTVTEKTGIKEQMENHTESLNKRLSEEMEELSARLKKEIEDENSSLGDSPSEEDEKRMQVLRGQMFRNIMQAQAEGNERLTKETADIRQSYIDDIMTIAQAVAHEHGASIILKAYGVFWSEGSVDITDEVIERMTGINDKEPADSE